MKDLALLNILHWGFSIGAGMNMIYQIYYFRLLKIISGVNSTNCTTNCNSCLTFASTITIAYMEYSKTYTVKDEHIDFQNIMDGLYYPFYMEYCRHDYIKEVLGFDFVKEAENGVNMVLSKYTLQFVRSLKKGDQFIVTCSLMLDKNNKSVLHFRQAILLNNKIVTKAVFSGTCVKAGGGRPFLPENLLQKLAGAPEWDGEL
jgi:acyl-CoA thioester hydrolase